MHRFLEKLREAKESNDEMQISASKFFELCFGGINVLLSKK